MTAVDVNLLGTVHGGVIMKFMDDAAGATAARHCGFNAVTVAVDEIDFLVPVRVGDLVYAHARVLWTGHSSLEVGVQVSAERWNEAGTQPVDVASAHLVFVGVDADGRPRPVPPLLPGETEQERLEFDQQRREADIRREHRLARRRALENQRTGR